MRRPFRLQIDKQAEDRAHRLGQTRPVTVYRLVTRNSVDSNVQVRVLHSACDVQLIRMPWCAPCRGPRCQA